MKIKITFILLITFLTHNSDAQVTLNWTHFLEQRSKPAGGSDLIAVSSTGNVFVPYAHAYPGILNNTASIVTLRGSDGAQIYKYNLPQLLSSFGDYPAGFAMDGSNNIYTGFTYNYDDFFDLEDARFFKHNSTLVPQWDRYNYATAPPGSDYSLDLAFYPGALFWLVQRRDSGLCVSKYTTAGVLLWRKFITGSLEYIRTDAAGNFYLLGKSYNGSFDYDILIRKYNSTGILQWERYLHASNGSMVDEFGDFAYDAAGNVYVTGTGQRSATGRDIVTAKYNSSGTLQWSKLISGSGNNNDYGNAIAVDSVGNVYIAGSIYESNAGVLSDNIIIRKYSPTGAVLATRKYNYGSGVNDSPSDIKVTRAGKVYVAGKTGVSYLFQQYSTALGLPEYSDFYTPDTASLVPGIETMEAKGDYILIKNNKAYVLGEFYFDANCCPDDFYIESFVRKYSIPSPAPRLTYENNLNELTLKVYPNPVNDVLNIEIDSDVEQLNIYDMTGRTVMEINNKATKNELNISGLISGLYIIQVHSKDGLMTARFVKK